MMRSISSRIAFHIILVSLPLLIIAGTWVTYISVTQQESEILQRGKSLAKSGAAVYGSILQRGVETKVLTWDDLAKPQYTLIEFSGITVEEPRYHSTFDWFTDRSGIQYIEDSITASDPMLLYAVGNDLTGYIPTAISKFSHPPTGDTKKDAINARSKRRFETPMHKNAAAWKGAEPLVQEYHRDTGHVAWDIAYPIWIRNPTTQETLHWGSFRVGVRQDKIAEVRDSIMIRLILGFAVFEVVLGSVMYLLTRHQLHPLKILADKVDAVSRGEDGQIVGSQKGDANEIIMVASSIRRLQRSLHHAMSRLRVTPSSNIATEIREDHPPSIQETPQ